MADGPPTNNLLWLSALRTWAIFFASVDIILFALVKLRDNILRPAGPPALVGSQSALVIRSNFVALQMTR
jgi:hypothetical protein